MTMEKDLPTPWQIRTRHWAAMSPQTSHMRTVKRIIGRKSVRWLQAVLNIWRLGYADGSGQTIIRQALESGDFTKFIGGDGMVLQSLIDAIGAEALEGMIITSAGSSEGQGKDNFEAMWKAEGFDDSPYAPQAYDATFLLALAMEKKGNAEREGMSEALRAVAGPPGMQVYAGEWDKALAALKQGEDINYEGAAGSQDFDENGDVAGVIVEVTVQGGQLVEIGPIM